MIKPKTKFRFSVQNHDFWQALEGSDHFMPPPPYQRAQYESPTQALKFGFTNNRKTLKIPVFGGSKVYLVIFGFVIIAFG